MYKTWHLTRQKAEGEDAFAAKHERGKGKKAAKKGSDALDKGVIFLENAYRSLKDNGRFGIILSNSIASINKWIRVRTGSWTTCELWPSSTFRPTFLPKPG